MAKIGIVTDSTAYIPQEFIAKYDIEVAPAVVIWSGEEFADGVDLQPKDFYTRLATAKEMPGTSQPSPAVVKKAVENLQSRGYDQILGIFLSEKLSGTIDSARQVKEMMPDLTFEIVDTMSASMGSGWPIMAGARAIERGANLKECIAIVEEAREHTDVVLMVDTLEFLHRGGRIGGAQAFIGTALNFKPILEVEGGVIEPVERVRTHKKAVNRLVELAVERTGGRDPVYLAALHANVEEEARRVLDIAAEQLNPVETVLSDVSPAVGTHTGPGTLGLAFMAGMEM